MSKLFRLPVLFCLLLCLTVRAGALAPADITAASAVLIDADTGQVLFDKSMHVRRAPASITKVMTGLLVLEACETDEMVAVTETAVDIPRYSSHVALTPGEDLPVDSALYAMMLPSANDAANALAEHVAGSQEAFTARMNSRAAELGALDTHFTNAHGLPDNRHYTTAYDMALITRAAIRTPGFLDYFGAGRHTIPATNKQSQERPFTNQDYMLLPDMWVYNPEVIGGKVGYTEEARHTMTSAAVRDGRTLIAVVLGCGIDDKFYDTQTLFDYGFDSFAPLELSIPPELLSGLKAPVIAGEETVGEAVFSPEEDTVTVLAPPGASLADIAFDTVLPERVEKEGRAKALLLLTIPSPGGGAPLRMEVPLSARISLDPSPEAVDVMTGTIGTAAAPDRSAGFWWWLAGVPAALLLSVVLVRRQKIKSRAARRRRRRERVIRDRQEN